MVGVPIQHMGDAKWVSERLRLLARKAPFGNPTIEIMSAYLRTLSAKATAADLREYKAIRDHFANDIVQCPDGEKRKLSALQREYLRHEIVNRYRDAKYTWEQAFEAAAQYVSEAKQLSAKTVQNRYWPMKKLLEKDEMRRFCEGLEYEFPIAKAGKDDPEPGTFVDPEFLREPDGE